MSDLGILEGALGAAVPHEFAALSDEQLHAFAAALVAARSRRRQQVQAAISGALDLLPAPAREAARKVPGTA